MANGGRILVAGAGVTGLTVALRLARAGRAVTVCDLAPLGDNASGVAAGMLAPAMEAALDPLARDHYPLMIAARDLWPKLAASVGIPLDRSGVMAQGPSAWLARVEQALEAVGAPALRTPEGLFTAEDWRIEPGPALVMLKMAAEEAGARFREAAVTAFAPGEATLSDGSVLAAEWLVLATGMAPGLAPEQAALSPIKGHILRLPVAAGAGPVIRGQGVYVCPGDEGLLVGATMEAGRNDLAVDPEQIAALRAAVSPLMPIDALRATARVGVRASTPDGLPLVGPSAARGIILAAGLRRNGWLLAPLVAEIVAAYVAGGDPGPWAGAFDPARFNTDHEG